MIIETIIDFRLEYDSNTIFNFNNFKNIDEMVLNSLITKFKNKTFNRMFIIDIIKILNRTDCISIKNNSNGDMYINVRFLTKCLKIMEGEIIVNNKIIQINENGLIIGVMTDNDNIKSIVKSNSELKYLTKGKIFPIIVSRIEYKNDANIILLKSIPFKTNDKFSSIYNMLDKIYFIIKNSNNKNEDIPDNVSTVSRKKVEDIPDNVSTVSRRKVEWYNKKTFQNVKDEIEILLLFITKKYTKKDIEKYENKLCVNIYDKEKPIELHTYNELVYVPANFNLNMYAVINKENNIDINSITKIQHNEFLLLILNQKLLFLRMFKEFMEHYTFE